MDNENETTHLNSNQPQDASSDTGQKDSKQRSGRRALGMLLLLPAVLCWLTILVLPTLQTAIKSLQESGLPGSAGRFVGLENYSRLFDAPMAGKAVWLTITIMLVRLFIVTLAPLLLALAARAFGRPLRLVLRLLTSIPLALYAPVPFAFSALLLLNPQTGLFGKTAGFTLTEPAAARLVFILLDGLMTFGIACAVGTAVYLAVLRGAEESTGSQKTSARPLLMAWLVMAFTAAALALQSFTLSYLLHGGGPLGATTTLAMLQYNAGFMRFDFGGAAAASALALVPLLLLGLGAGVIIALSRPGLVFSASQNGGGRFGGAGKVLWGLSALLVLLLGGLPGLLTAAWPGVVVLQTAGGFGGALQNFMRNISLVEVIASTILPAAITVLFIQLPVAYLAALAVGALRPLGRRSEWLLVIFSPWLFVTSGPLSIIFLQRAINLKLVGTAAALAPPLLLNLPMLFILAFFFSGKEPQWRSSVKEAGQPAIGSFFRTLVLPSLPLAAILALGATIIHAQELLWPMLVSPGEGLKPIPVALMMSVGFALEWQPLAAALVAFGLPTFLFIFIILALFQMFYIDKLSLVPGDAPISSRNTNEGSPLE